MIFILFLENGKILENCKHSTSYYQNYSVHIFYFCFTDIFNFIPIQRILKGKDINFKRLRHSIMQSQINKEARHQPKAIGKVSATLKLFSFRVQILKGPCHPTRMRKPMKTNLKKPDFFKLCRRFWKAVFICLNLSHRSRVSEVLY